MSEPSDLAWLAGLWDGEGSVGINDRGVAVQLEMTHEATVARAAEILRGLGVGALTYNYRSRQPMKHRAAWYIRVNRLKDVLVMADALLPYSTTKVGQWLTIASYVRSRLSHADIDESGRVRRGGKYANNPLTTHEIDLFREIRELNRRGPR